MPICRKCGVDKPQELFTKDKSRKSGYTSRCHACTHVYKMQWAIDNNVNEKRKDYFKEYNASPIANERKKRWREENREQHNESNRLYRANNPDVSCAYYIRNKDKLLKNHSLRYQKNKEAYNLINRAWRKANPEKHRIHNQNRENRKHGGKLSLDIIQKLGIKQNWLCTYCKIDLTTCKNHLDHIIPLAKGGKHEDENVQLLCQSCNLRKHTTLHENFILKIGVSKWP